MVVPKDLKVEQAFELSDASAERRFGPFREGDYREFNGRRLKIIGRTRQALSFTTSPIAFLDYRLAQSLSPGEDIRFLLASLVVVIVGADSPSVPADFIDQAFKKLEDASLVIGPATDGGYYLLGCAGPPPPIFHDIEWGSKKVLWQSISRTSDPRWQLALLPPWYDVDTLADLWTLKGHIATMRLAGFDPQLPCTERVLQELS